MWNVAARAFRSWWEILALEDGSVNRRDGLRSAVVSLVTLSLALPPEGERIGRESLPRLDPGERVPRLTAYVIFIGMMTYENPPLS